MKRKAPGSILSSKKKRKSRCKLLECILELKNTKDRKTLFGVSSGSRGRRKKSRNCLEWSGKVIQFNDIH